MLTMKHGPFLSLPLMIFESSIVEDRCRASKSGYLRRSAISAPPLASWCAAV
jgi:hypothetical protein